MQANAIFARKLTLTMLLAVAAASVARAQTSFDRANVGATKTSTITIALPAATTLGSIAVTAQGNPALDFTNAGTGTCAAGSSYAANDSCTVDVNFKPVYAGTRLGAVVLEDHLGNTVASVNLVGIGLGPQIAFDPGTASAIDPLVNGTGLQQPYGVAVDGEGNVYIADTSHKRVIEMPTGDGAPFALDPIVNGKGLAHPAGLVVDAAGDLLIADLHGDFVEEIPAGGGAPTLTDPVVNGSGLKYPCGMAVDAAGDLYLADVDNSRVLEFSAGGGSPIVINPTVDGKTLNYPVAVALDSAGDLYISDLFANHVVEMPVGGGAPVAIAPMVGGVPLTFPYGIAVDAAGNLFIADANNRVVVVPADGSAATAIVPTANGLGLNDPIGIALDSAGNLFIADSNNNRVLKVTRSAPPSLNFAQSATGSMSSDSPQTVDVENAGNAALTFPVPGTGGNPTIGASFTLASGSSGECPLVSNGSTQAGTLAAGSSCVLPISFVPSVAGSVYGALTLTDDSLNAAAPGYATQTIVLSGDAPAASLSAASLSFGAQQLGTTSSQQPLTLTNTGSATMTISNVSVTGTSGTAFLLANGCGATLDAGANCVIQGQFEPASAGPANATIKIVDSAADSPQTVTLTGAGAFVPTVSATPSASSITTAQPLTVTVAVNGPSGDPAPTGFVALVSGSYKSQPVVLAGGGATIDVPAGALAVGTDSLALSYAPDHPSDALYLGATGTGAVTVTAASTATAPTATTTASSAVTSNSITLTGTVNPNGAATQAWFVIGTDSGLAGGSQTTAQNLDIGNTPVTVSANITGLVANTTYYYQVVAMNSAGQSSGAIDSFTTTLAPYFSISNGAAISVTPGATTGNTSTLTIAPQYGFSGTLNLSCTVSFTGQGTANDSPTCSVPATATLANVSTPVQVTIATTAATAASLARFGSATGAVALACVLFLCFPVRRRPATLAALMLLIFAAGMGCGGGSTAVKGPPPNPGTTAGSYVVAVTGTSGAITEAGTVALTVQ
jgi:sugar lactone lactonase YvrE